MTRRAKRSTRPAHAPDGLSERIFADLLSLPNETDIGETLARRVRHLPVRQQLIVIGQVAGFLTLTVQQVREMSTTGADVLREIRDGITGDVVAGTLWKGGDAHDRY